LPEAHHVPARTHLNGRFDSTPWDGKEWTFTDKRFVHVTTKSFLHIPINMGKVFGRAMKDLDAAHAFDEEFAVLSHDPSPWHSDHYIAVNKDLPGFETVKLSGTFVTKAFEGPYRNAPQWIRTTQAFAAERGKQPKKVYLYYTTCPKCAKHYGKNPVVAFAEV